MFPERLAIGNCQTDALRSERIYWKVSLVSERSWDVKRPGKE